MSKMRTILKNLMDTSGKTAYDIFHKTGIHPSTIYRFLDGGGEPKAITAEKIARVFGVTVSQLRGDTPIEGTETPIDEPLELKDLLTLNEFKHVSNMKNLNRETRGMLYRLAEMLVKVPEAVDRETLAEKRSEVTTPNPQLRAGEEYYQAPPKKKRIKESYDGRKTLRSKSPQTA